MNVKKDPKKALLLSLFPGLGFLYLENVRNFIGFFVIILLPLSMYGTMGFRAIITSLAMYVLSIVYCNNQAIETLKNPVTLRKDPYYMMCLSLLLDGLGQLMLKHRGKAFIMMSTGFTACVLSWAFVLTMFPASDILNEYSGTTFTIVNFMVVWTIASIPIKILSLIDAFYSTFHLYVAKRE